MSTHRLTRLAMTVAACMLAHQVAAKAIRDTFFLTVFPATSLPRMVIGAAIVALITVPIFTRLIARFGPRRVVPIGFLISAVVHAVEWWAPGLTAGLAIAVYLHVAAFGALLLSGFWSLASETFDPITAKRSYGRIAAAGTIGGIGGGLAAERMAVWLPLDAPLLVLAFLHLACGVVLIVFARFSATGAERPGPPAPTWSLEPLRAPHVRQIAILVLLGTAGAAVIDYLFKSRAVATYGSGADLLQFFALFYVVTQVLTFLLQTYGTDRAVARFGIGGTVNALPLGAGAGAIGALLVPTLGMVTIARGLESVLRGSLFRSGYEILFTPMGPAEKRRVKTFLDVACDRAGDAVGAGLVQVALVVAPVFLMSELLGVVIAMALASMFFGFRLNAAYNAVVQRRLVDHAHMLRDGGGDLTGWTSRSGIRSQVVMTKLPVTASVPVSIATVSPAPRPDDLDPSTRVLADLRSGDRDRVLRALRGTAAFETFHIAQLVTLLAWDDVKSDAARALERAGEPHVGLYLDHLLAPDVEFAIRRRLPRVIAKHPSQRALDGLITGLDDARFEVRYQCSRAIDLILQRQPQLTVDRARIFAVLERELSVTRTIWNGYRVLDADESGDANPVFDDQVVDGRRSVEYVFSLLASILPREPLKAAYRAVHTDDRLLRGLALDYLNGMLPEGVKQLFWTVLDVDAGSLQIVDPNEALTRLLQSQDQTTTVTRSASDVRGQSDPPRSAR